MSSTVIDGFFPRVSLRFSRLTDAVLIPFARNLITMITGNPALPTPSPALPVVTAAVDDFDTKVQEALNEGKIELAARNSSRVALLSVLRPLASYVQGQSNGDLQTILSSGFEAVRAPSPSVVPATPSNPRFAYTGVTGELMFRFEGDNNVKNFSVQHATGANGPWIDHDLSSSTRVRIPDLTAGTMYWGRARANAAAGSSDWCVPTCKMAI